MSEESTAGESSSESSSEGQSSEESLEETADKSRNAAPDKEEHKKERTNDGAVAIIYHKNPETGEVEFYFEEKPSDYAFPEYRGKLSLIGGSINKEDKSSLEALIREIGEEIKSEEAQAVLKSVLSTNKDIYHTLIEKDGSKLYRTFVYIIEVKYPAEWAIVKSSPLTHDAGPKRILTLEELAKKGKQDFAFGMWYAVEKFLSEYLDSYLKAA